jgi:hypothetical protein
MSAILVRLTERQKINYNNKVRFVISVSKKAHGKEYFLPVPTVFISAYCVGILTLELSESLLPIR